MMATYFNGGSEIQADNLQTLYLMNRGGYAAYSSDASQPPPGVLLLNNGGGNSASALAHQGSIHHHHQHHLVGTPLSGATSTGNDPGRPSLHEISTVGSSTATLHGQLVPRFHYNLWGGDGGDPSPSGGHQIPTAIDLSGGGSELGSSMGFRRPAPVTIAATSSTLTLDHHHHHHNHHQQGGLSLSLNNSSPHKNAAARPMAVLSPGSGTPTSASGVSHGGALSMIAGSKFLKAAQQLLDEVVNVGKAIDSKTDGISAKDKAKAVVVGSSEGSCGGGQSGGAKGAVELTTAQRQELQMKKAKLLNMLDEVEQRYRQYHSQMQMVAASFEQAAGEESAKSYTALALQTISKQFRCLKDAIVSQIKATGKSMGEEEDDDKEAGEGKARSRLRMVDHQLRQQRALQQLGMMHHNAWRPQRGLPERAVSVLRAWLFEHFLHPYPKDSDKHMLAKQTGLTRSQVSNWFINARVRLWKPMVEEMYVEEMKSEEQNGSDNNHATTTTNTIDHNNDAASPKTLVPLHSRHGHNHSFNQNPQELLAPNDVVSNPAMTTLLSPSSSNGPLQGFSLLEMDPMVGHRSPKKQRMMINSDVIPTTTILTSMDKLEMKPGGRDLFPPDLTGFGSYPMGEIGSRFNPDQHQYHQGNTVSLTLGLPHDCDQSLSLSATHQQSYFPGHGGQAVQLPPHSASAGGGYEEMNDVQNRKRFAAHLLPDYVT